MRRPLRRPYRIVLATLAVAAFLLVGWYLAMIGTATPASADNLCAPSSSYTTIQDAINDAGDGDTVQIVHGTWYENLDITETITLQGGWNKGCTVRTPAAPQDTTIDGGAADHVVEITGGSTATLDGLTLTNGHAKMGGGVYVSGASPTLDNVVVASNVISPTGSGPANWAYGGGVYVYDGTITLTDCDITDNTCYPGVSDNCFGGGLALDAIYGAEGRAVLENTHIMSNTNPSDSYLLGGGLYLDPGSQVTFEGTENRIAYNEARAGGGVYMYGDVDLERVLILENYASMNGGGIFLASGFNGGRIANNYLVGNNANTGASVLASDMNVEIANNTIVGDFSGSGAGILVVDTGGGVLELTNNVVVSHTIGIKRSDAGSASATLANNDVWDNTTDYAGFPAGSGDISLDPGFEDPDNGDYHLGSESPCIDAGTYVEGLYFDYDGDRRTGRLLDIGADEYHMDPFFIPVAVRNYSP